MGRGGDAHGLGSLGLVAREPQPGEAGGRGERFWPQSRESTPKHLLPIVGDKPMLTQTVDRVSGVVPPEKPELGQLWAWDGKAWSLVPAQGPSMRTVFGAAYDTRRKRIVLFGGTGNTALLDKRDDTWEWDGRAWHRMADTSAGTRDHHGMVYDAGRRRTVLYGGVTSENLPDGSRTPAKDTWEWDGKKWTRIAAQGAMPPGGGAMAYDAKRKQVVLFGGLGALAVTNRLGDGNEFGAGRIDGGRPVRISEFRSVITLDDFSSRGRFLRDRDAAESFGFGRSKVMRRIDKNR